MDNIDKVERGEDPMNVFYGLTANDTLKLPTEESAGTRRRFTGSERRQMLSSAGAAGGATKFSPVLNRGDGATTVTAEEVLNKR
jgi:hypothetical protein